MRRLGMKNKRGKSETASDSESEENVGARAASDNAETQAAGRNSNAQKSAAKRRSSRGASRVQKPAAYDDDDDAEMDAAEPEERENGEKIAGQKPTPNKRRKKDQRASTSARDKPELENEYEVWRCLLYPSPPLILACHRRCQLRLN